MVAYSSGEIQTLSVREYDSHPAIRNSTLKIIFFKSFAHSLVKTTPTLNMEVGTALHSAVLTPEIFYEENQVGKNKTSFKVVDGIRVWGSSPWGQIHGMRESLERNPAAMELLRGTLRERSFFWSDPRTGLARKCRADAVSEGLGVVVDLKTVPCSEKEKFELHSFDMKYHFQMADYLDGIRRALPEVRRAVLIAVERVPPYSIGIFEVSPDLLDLGLKLRDAAHDRYLEIKNKKYSESYLRLGETHITKMSAPFWAYEKEMKLLTQEKHRESN